ncbi:MAG: molybdopterin-dependent oxidoreductase [Acidimicrobiales bacterium]|nr:molybdopterin-dependent oxidoreductase [Acidimicrobiales bacterium]
MERTDRPPFALASAAGLVAAGAGLATAELLASSSRRLRSPVLDVGDRVIDRVPAWLKNLAIDWFGTNDKTALLVGIGATLAVYAALVGIAWLRHRRWIGIVGISAFGLLGAAAATQGRVDRPWWAATPSLVGALMAAGVLLGVEQLLGASDRVEGDNDNDERSATEDRRRVVVGLTITAAMAAVAAVIGRRLQARFSAAGSREAVALPGPDRPLPAAPVAVAVDGAVPFYTPNSSFYRIDTALTVPQVPAESWRLRVHGMVERELEFTYDELVSRRLVESDITLTCVSNEVGGSLVGNARWLGARLDDLLDEAGVDAAADQIVGRSVDGYTCGFPVAALDGRDALIAVAMNGEPLPLAHGFPARLIVPGLYGYVSATKWLTEIELTTFERFDQYWVPRGWDALAPIKTQSRIDTPHGLEKVPAAMVAVAGVAWAQTRGIERVEVSVDDGPWSEASLAEELVDTTWRQWRFEWDASSAGPGRHTLTVRATERGGAIQTGERSEPMPNGASGRHQIVVLVEEPS